VSYSYSASALGHLDNYTTKRSKTKLFHAFRMEIVCDTQEIPAAIYRLALISPVHTQLTINSQREISCQTPSTPKQETSTLGTTAQLSHEKKVEKNSSPQQYQYLEEIMIISKRSRDHSAGEIFTLHLHMASEHSRLFP